MLRIDRLCAFYGRHQVLRDVTLKPLEPGQVVGVIGPNAAGKSTLIKAVVGLVKTVGSVRWQGSQGAARLSDIAGYVPQDLPSAVALSVIESTIVSAQRYCGEAKRVPDARTRAIRALESVRMIHAASRMLGHLSGGQRQLVSIAHALATDPRLLLLDEPTSALDVSHQLDVMQLVGERTRGDGLVTMVALHDLTLAARFCDRLIVVRDGQIAADGAPADVVTPQLLGDVYGIEADVLSHEGAPLVCPLRRLNAVGGRGAEDLSSDPSGPGEI